MKKTFEIQKLVVVKEKTVEYESFKEPLKSSANVVDISRDLGIHENAEEVFCIYSINAKGQIIAFHEVAHGDLCSATTHPREIFKRALLNNAGSVILVHNHPSGDPIPSEIDITTTERLINAGDILGVPVIDHIILGDDNYISMRAAGLMNEMRV